MGWLDRLLNRTEAVASAGPVPPARSASSPVSFDSALTIPAMYRAMQILATSVAQLPMTVVRRGQPMETPPTLATKPNLWETPGQFWKRTVIGLAGTGNAFWKISRDPGTNAVINLEALNPLGMTWETDRAGRRVWHHSDLTRGPATYRDTEIQHLRLLEVPGHVMGLGPIQACRQSLGGAIDLRRYAETWFSDSGIPTGVLSTDQNLTPVDVDAARKRWHETQAKRDIAVLSKGLSYEAIILNPSDAQFLESQQFSVTDIARMMGIPAPYLLAAVDGSTFTYQNLEQVETTFARTTLMAYMLEIEDALTALLPNGQTAKFDLSMMLRPDARTSAEIDAIYLAAGVLTVAEVRARKGLPALPPAQLPSPAEVTQ